MQLHAFANAQNQRSHHQAYHVIHQKRRQDAAGKDDARQKVLRREMLDHQMRNPLEKTGQVQAGDNQHHGEEQHQGQKIDAGDGLRGRKNTEDKHEHRANDRHRRPVDLGARQAAHREHEVAHQEDRPGDDHVFMRERPRN